MLRNNYASAIALFLTLVLLSSKQILASPAQVSHFDVTPHCDFLSIPTQVDELGDPNIFPSDEAIATFPLSTAPPVCTAFDDPTALDLVVEMRNLTNKTFEQVWYVANPETDISNYDGFANDLAFPGGHEAFRIDSMISDPFGTHHPLIFESGPLDGEWQPGEVWHFVLQDYFNAIGLSHAAIDSIGVGDASNAFGITTSSGSIIAIVPEPATCSLLLFGLVGLCSRGKRGH